MEYEIRKDLYKREKYLKKYAGSITNAKSSKF